MRRIIPLLVTASLVGRLGETEAADHRDGPVAQQANEADIADVFAFPVDDAPGGTRRLVLAMTVSPRASFLPAQRFSDAVIYRFRLRPARIEPASDLSPTVRPGTTPEGEIRVACVFGRDATGQRQTVTCRAAPAHVPGLPGDGTCAAGACVEATAMVDTVDASTAPTPLRVFAGRRADPFFSDVFRARAEKRPRVPDPDPVVGINAFGPSNVLGIVVELDIDAVLGGTSQPLYGVVAETLRRP